MKKILRTFILITVIMGISFKSYSQISDLGLLLSGGTQDAAKLLGAYVKPFTNAFGYSLNTGWYNTAKVHSLLGFDFTLNFDVALIPTEDKTFDVKKLSLSSYASVGSPSIAQTIAGKASSGPSIVYTDNGHQIVSYNTPGGINLGFVPMPMMQLGLGLVKGTEIIGRLIPSFNIGNGGDNKIGMWGIGLKHSIKQWIPAIDELPFLNISVLFGYTRFHMVNNLSIDPLTNFHQFYSTQNIYFIGGADSLDYSNQQMDLMVKSFTADALVSLDVPVITLYAGIGISSTNTELKLLGYYPTIPMTGYNVSQNQIDVTSADIKKDPIKIAIKGGTKPILTFGLKLKMGIFSIHADYTYANYSIASAGLGFSFR